MVKKKSLLKRKKFFKQYSYQLLSAVLILGIVAVFFLTFYSRSTTTSPAEEVVTVNGDAITMADVQNRLSFATGMGAMTTEEEVIDELVTETLLLQEAERRGVSVSAAQFEEEYQTLLMMNGITEQDLMGQLGMIGVSLEYFKEYFRANVVISQMLDDLVETIEVSDDEINMYYVQNLDQFSQPSASVVRHILVSNDVEGYEQEAERIRGLIADDFSNYCDLVEEHTDDVASAGTCGEYTVSAGDPFVEEFKQAALEMEVGELRSVETDFGVHIMLKQEELPERDLPLSEVRSDIESFLKQSQAQEEFEALLLELQQNAVII